MILRSLRLVHFRGLPEIRLGDAPERGVVRVPLSPSAGPDTLADALRFVVSGVIPGVARGTSENAVSVLGEGQGLAFVEAAFRTADGEDFSLFRGVDRRGTTQVSLREEGGRRVSGGDEATAARLDELIGQPVSVWCERSLGVDVPDDVEGAPARPVADAATIAAGEESALAAHRAVQELRRSLRAERLRLLASRRHAELLDLGRRLRHERGTVARESDRESVERDRVRTRLRRVNEYRAQLARGENDDAPETTHAGGGAAADVTVARGRARRPGALTELVFLACAACTFGALVLYSTSARADADGLTVPIGLGVGCAVAVASYLHVASRGNESEAAPRSRDERRDGEARAWRESLRRRFADLGDPDAAGLPDELRQRLSELDARLSPLRSRLERLDDAVTVFDVEAGRAARALHETLPELGPGVEGLPGGSAVEDAVSSVHALGDAVYAAVVERDALLSEGTATPAEARQALSVALDAMTDRIGAPGAVAALLRRVDSFACAVGEAPEEDHLADLLDAEIVRIEAEPPVWTGLAAAHDATDGTTVDGLTVLAADADDLTDDDLIRRFGDAAQILVPAAAPGARSSDRVRRPGASRRPQ